MDIVKLYIYDDLEEEHSSQLDSNLTLTQKPILWFLQLWFLESLEVIATKEGEKRVPMPTSKYGLLQQLLHFRSEITFGFPRYKLLSKVKTLMGLGEVWQKQLCIPCLISVLFGRVGVFSKRVSSQIWCKPKKLMPREILGSQQLHVVEVLSVGWTTMPFQADFSEI